MALDYARSLAFKLKKYMHTLKIIWVELKRHKIGLIGLSFLITQITLLALYPYVADHKLIENWNNASFIASMDTPELAPPIWVSFIDPKAPPPTRELSYKEISVHREDYDLRIRSECISYYVKRYNDTILRFIKERIPLQYVINSAKLVGGKSIGEVCNSTLGGKIIFQRITVYYNHDRDGEPLDIIFRIRFKVNDVLYSIREYPQLKQGFLIFVRRPDGVLVPLIPLIPDFGVDIPIPPDNPYDIRFYADLRSRSLRDFLRIPSTARAIFEDRDWVYEINKYYTLNPLMKDEHRRAILSEVMAKANYTGPVPIGYITDVLFKEATPEAFRGGGKPLKGYYTFEFLFLFQLKEGDEDKVVDVELTSVKILGGYGVLGTDDKGRDLWTAIVYGLRWALIIGVLIAVTTTILGTLYGVTSAYFGGKTDIVMQTIARIYVNIPVLPLLILVLYLLPRSIWLIIGIIILFNWIGGQFTIRSMALQIREQTYVEVARALGASHSRVILKYVFMQLVHYTFVSLAFAIPGGILTEAGLSFLGLGDPMVVTWGKVLEGAASGGAFTGVYYLWRRGHLWWVLSPGLAITFTSLTFIFLGQAIEKIVEPRLRTR